MELVTPFCDRYWWRKEEKLGFRTKASDVARIRFSNHQMKRQYSNILLLLTPAASSFCRHKQFPFSVESSIFLLKFWIWIYWWYSKVAQVCFSAHSHRTDKPSWHKIKQMSTVSIRSIWCPTWYIAIVVGEAQNGNRRGQLGEATLCQIKESSPTSQTKQKLVSQHC